MIGGLFSLYSQYQGMKASEAVGKQRAASARMQARMARRASESETTLAHERGRRFKAAQRAAYAKSGALPTSGTPLLVMMEQAGDIEQDIMMQRHEREKQAILSENRARMIDWETKQAKKAAQLGMAGTALGMVGQAISFGMSGGGGGGSATTSSKSNLMYRMH